MFSNVARRLRVDWELDDGSFDIQEHRLISLIKVHIAVRVLVVYLQWVIKINLVTLLLITSMGFNFEDQVTRQVFGDP